mgnify:CR=1 FL=1
MTEEERDELIQMALFKAPRRDYDYNPIRKSLDYMGIFRRTFVTDLFPMIPQGGPITEVFGDFDDYELLIFRAKTKSMQEEDGFIYTITSLAYDLKFTDEELAERFNVGSYTFKQWKNGPFPYPHIQKEIILFLNCARIETLICNQCDKKKIPTEMNNLTCKVCRGEK